MKLEFCVGRCQIGIGFSCFALLSACCLFTGMESSAACLLAIFLHECAHLAVMWAFHVPPDRVEVSALGCRVVRQSGWGTTDYQQMIISLAGPAINLLCFGMTALAGKNGDFTGVNLALGIAHSLPIEPLDGGLALRYFLQSQLEEGTAERVSRIVSLALLLPLSVLGFLVLLNTRYNYSLLALSVYLMLYMVLGKDYSLP